jgi:hypothetical protein
MAKEQRPPRSLRSLFVGRGAFDMTVWIAGLALAIFAMVTAARTGTGWGPAIAMTVMAVAYTFTPWVKEMPAARRARDEGTLTIDDWGVTRVAENIREVVAWDDLIWVRIYTTSTGPGAEDVFFALAGADGKGCLVPHGLARRSNLLEALQQRLPDFDNVQAAVAMGSTDDASFTVWTRSSGTAN